MSEQGNTLSGSAVSPSYASTERVKLKRVALAIFLCGIVACLSVSLISVVFIFVYNVITELVAPELKFTFDMSSEGFASGLSIAALGGAFNWLVGYLTIPAAWLALGLSIGRFPRRGISRPGPYYRWGAIWGAVLVGGVTGIFSTLIAFDSSSERAAVLMALGGALGGVVIGALGGLVCGGLFRLIVRPTAQLERVAAEVFT